MEFCLDGRNELIKYFGMGPTENYVDLKGGTKMGLYKSTVTDEYVDYIHPQEHGNHYNTKRAVVYDTMGRGVEFFTDGYFEFNASHYSAEDLEKAAHSYELVKQDKTIIRIDYKVGGIGSASCGTTLIEKYQLNNSHIEFNFSFRPIFTELIDF